ncbi:fluoride efflux transporter FluC [Sporosarcina beigongshangi]|uniref:fluoride efflux transporter FluC n=1 Tax=Sporosarcina beigongshangi TaxID=2782538 RepID=UPI001939379E|nr:CrcB family protein [Sporosarcina beigongshangi]
MRHILWVGLAGSLGAIARVVLGELIHSESGFPTATFIINLVGTFVLCFIVAGALRKLNVNQSLYDAVTTGFLGAFTTFSAVSMETVLLVESGQLAMAILYVTLSIIGGLAAGTLGFYFGARKVQK